jgi:hypothetical protein
MQSIVAAGCYEWLRNDGSVACTDGCRSRASVATLVSVTRLAPHPCCLRCASVALRRLDSPTEIAFFACPSCGRQYTEEPGGALTFRWGHPISLALYGVQFEPDPLPQAPRIAQAFVAQEPADRLAAMVSEIELELARPTQQVRDILGCAATEARCREFLAALTSAVSQALGRAGGTR